MEIEFYSNYSHYNYFLPPKKKRIEEIYIRLITTIISILSTRARISIVKHVTQWFQFSNLKVPSSYLNQHQEVIKSVRINPVICCACVQSRAPSLDTSIDPGTAGESDGARQNTKWMILRRSKDKYERRYESSRAATGRITLR